jgi:hypothetical protein
VTLAILPQPHESLSGFLRRLASAQSYSDVSAFLAGFGLTYGQKMIEALDSVELSLGVPPGSISDVAPCAGAERPVLEWRGMPAPPSALSASPRSDTITNPRDMCS